MFKRYGPLIAALTGAALVALELFGRRTEGPSIFWLIVGGLVLVLGVIGHIQQS